MSESKPVYYFVAFNQDEDEGHVVGYSKIPDQETAMINFANNRYGLRQWEWFYHKGKAYVRNKVLTESLSIHLIPSW